MIGTFAFDPWRTLLGLSTNAGGRTATRSRQPPNGRQGAGRLDNHEVVHAGHKAIGSRPFDLPGSVETHQVVVRNDAEVSSIEIAAPGSHTIDGHVTFQGKQFQCRIHPGARPHPARWIMSMGDTELHVATQEEFQDVPDRRSSRELGLLRLRREGIVGAGYGLVRVPDERRIGEVRFLRGRLIPKPRAPQYELEATQSLPETLEIFLAWIVVQGAFDFG